MDQKERAREVLAAEYERYGHSPQECAKWAAASPSVIAAMLAFAEQSRATDRIAVVEECAAKMRDAIGKGYPVPANKHDQCEHGKFGWEDCIACYDVALVRAISSLSKEHNHVEG